MMPEYLRKYVRCKGISIVELLTALSIAGLLAVFIIPKVIRQTPNTVNVVGKTESIMQQIAAAVKLYEMHNAVETDLTQISYDQIFHDYMSYMALKVVEVNGAIITYYYLHNGARLTVHEELFTTGVDGTPPDSLGEYEPAPLGNEWNGCGSFNTSECVYVDYNGRDLPNAIGKLGDLIPLRIDPTTGKVRSLYVWTQEETAFDPCPYVSSYDVDAEFTGASACP